MRKLVIASFLLASSHLALAQGTGDTPPPDESATKQDGEKPADSAEAKAPPDEGEPAEPEPEPVPEPKTEEKPAVTAVYDRGLKFESSDKQYGLKLMFRSQMRFESLRALEDGSQFLNKFYMPRLRFQAEGHVFGDGNRYKGEFGMGDSGSFAFPKDIFIEHRLAPGPVWLRGGQFRRPFWRQELVSDFAAEFNERSIVNELAGAGRDLGIALHNDYEKSAEGIEWVFGMFNGFSGGSDRPSIASACTTDATGKVTCINSRPTTFPTDFGPAIVARAGWNSARAKGYSEADLEGGPLRYSVAAAYKIDLANFAKHGKPSLADNLSHGLEVDLNLKVNGIGLQAGAVMMKNKDADAELGFLLQPGLMVVPKKVQVAARFAMVTEGDRNNIEALGAFNYYARGHQLKLSTDFGMLKKTGEDPTTMATDKPDIRIRVMGQLEM